MIKFYKLIFLDLSYVFLFPGMYMGDLSTGLIARYPFDGNASDMSV